MVFETIPNQLLYILIGAVFSSISALTLRTYQEYKQSVRTRRVLFSEMESMGDLLEELDNESVDNRPRRSHIEHQISTKMYDQHFTNLGRLTDGEITPVREFYQQVSYLRKSYLKYNQVKRDIISSDESMTKWQREQKVFSSQNIGRGANEALEQLEKAKSAREDMSFWQYIRPSLPDYLKK